MSRQAKLSEIWIKASILGAIWASSEIVFGSFLHNLKIPFSGNLLTGIGLIILISFSYIWTERGLFWKAGLITALLKTMSPSAVIFGPMIAIFAESVLLEVSTLIFGRTIFGFLLGASLAMSWNLFQKIINLIIFYGNNIVELYTKLVETAQQKLNIEFDIVWIPVILLLLVYIALGVISGIVGIRIGRKLKSNPVVNQPLLKQNKNVNLQDTIRSDFNYSLAWFFANIILVVGSLVLLALSPWNIWLFATPVLVIIWTLRYKRALRQIARPKFWIYFVIITLLITLVFSNEATTAEKILLGVQMNYRAAVIILGFTVMGTELYNPRIRSFLKRSSFKQLSVALELSFESLPSAIANMPDIKSIMKNPAVVLSRFVSLAEKRFSEIKNKRTQEQRVFIISGSVGEGKTTCVQNIIDILRRKNIRMNGLYSLRVMEKGNTKGYDIVDIEGGERIPFLRSTGEESFDKIGKYFIYPEGIKEGNDILHNIKSDNCDLVIIDEVGRLELEEKGWAGSLREILSSSLQNILITVRKDFIEDVTTKFGIEKAEVFNVSGCDAGGVAEYIRMKLEIGEMASFDPPFVPIIVSMTSSHENRKNTII